MKAFLFRVIGMGGMLCCVPLMAQEPAVRDTTLPEYTIHRTDQPLVIDGRVEERAWQAAENVDAFLFPWWTAGEREPTEARMLWDDKYLYVAFVAYDKHISAVLTERDDPVSRDDAVEVFMAPFKDDVRVYFNFEFNALGTILDRSPQEQRSKNWNAQGLQVAVGIDGTLNDETDEDRLWVTEIAIAFDDIAPFAPRLPPQDGDVWRLNLYRIGGQVNPQYSLWSDTLTEKPQYHKPERFGVVQFSTVAVDTAASGKMRWGSMRGEKH